MNPSLSMATVRAAIDRAAWWQYPLADEWSVDIGERTVTHKDGTYQIIRYVSLIDQLMEERHGHPHESTALEART
jgi:hypothetical protein